MATSKRKRGELNLPPFIEIVGLATIMQQIELSEIIDTVRPKKVIKALGIEQLVANLSAAQRRRVKDLLG